MKSCGTPYQGHGGQDGNHTLRWDQNLPAAQRFVILAAFNNAAVLDNNTGLVWERSPQTETNTWYTARNTCIAVKNVGGQKGWRLPSIPELTSLIDPNVFTSPALPPGHPFLNVQSANYWSATTSVENPLGAWKVDFFLGGLGTDDKTASSHVWCVRGGMNADAY